VMLGLAELANSGVTTVHNWSHNNRSPLHADAELEAHRNSLLRARYSMGHVDRLPVDVVNKFEDLDRVQHEWFDDQSRLDGLVHLGVNLRGMVQSEARVFHTEMEDMTVPVRTRAVSKSGSRGLVASLRHRQAAVGRREWSVLRRARFM